MYHDFGIFGISSLRRACLAYNIKASQLFELRARFGPDKLMIIDYDDLVDDSNKVLQVVYDFFDINYKYEYAAKIHSKSIDKIKSQSKREADLIKTLCMPTYSKAITLLTPL